MNLGQVVEIQKKELIITQNNNFADAITQNNFDEAIFFFNRGNAYRELGNKEKALEDYQKAAELFQQQDNTEL